MEPDDIKKIWQAMDLLREKQHVSDSRIKEMLKNEGKSALEKLIKMAKLGITAPIPLGLLFCLISQKFFEAGGYYVICPLAFLLICILLVVPHNIKKYRFLKEIDYSKMTVKEVTEKILKYQGNVQKFQLYGTIGFFIFVGVWSYLYYMLCFGSKIIWGFIIYQIVICLANGLIIIPFLYKKLYYNNINRIKASLEELKEFEEL